jgi:hypothetical protein
MNMARWLLYIQIASISPYKIHAVCPLRHFWCCGVLVVEIGAPGSHSPAILPVTHTFLLTPDHTIDPPSPRLLAIHRAIARILNLSGAGVYIDRILRDLEEVEIKEDGSTELAPVLSLKLGGWSNGVSVC